ncbi:MAG: thioredoxin family protein [Bacteroidota bacterium]
MNAVVEKSLADSMSYAAYRELVDTLVAEGKTTGPNQSEAMVGYTKLNAARMRRLEKTFTPLPELETVVRNIDSPQTWLIITEAWCGDAAQILPIVEQLAALNPHIQTQYVLRDENEDLMDMFLTQGSKSIPIVILIDQESGEVKGHWGPRPAEAQQMVLDRKADPSPTPYQEFQMELQKWYMKDKAVSIQREFGESFSL